MPTIRRSILGVAIALTIAVAGVLVFAGVAGASPTPASTQAPTSKLICSSGGASGSAVADSYLPANRWSGAISKQHTRLNGGFLGVGDIGQVVQRNVFVGGATAIGASEWKLGIAATEMASQFCFANSVGNAADTLAGGLGRAIETSGIISALVALAIVMAIWRLSRGQQRQWGKVFRLLIIVGVFVIIVASSTGATGTATPPRLSPGGIIDTVYGAISNFANGPTNAIATAASNAINTSHSNAVANQDPLDCYWYTQALVTKYKQSYGVANTSYSVPVGLNAMWEQAAIPTYTSEQFGAQNNFGDLVYCHLLEDQAGVPAKTQLDIERATGKTAAAFPLTQPLANPWYGGRTNTYEDASLVAWAACQSPTGAALHPTEWNLTTGQQLATSEWTLIRNPAQRTGGTQITTTDCRFWWVAKANGGGAAGYTTTGKTVSALSKATFNPEKSPFNWTTNSSNITSAVAQISTQKLSTGAQAGAGIANFLDNLHGTTNADAEASAVVFFLSSTVIMLVFLILSAALMIAKLSLLVSMMLLPVMLLLALFPGSLSSRLPGYLKHLLSLIIFATCAGILLSLVALVTAMIADLGTAIGGQGSIVALLWVAISPVAAVVIIHHFFKKVLKAPSPFTPSAALAYGAAAGGFAGGAGAGLLDMSAVKSMIRQGQRFSGRGGQSRGGTGGTRPGNRRGGMEPGTPGGPGATTKGKGRGAGDTTGPTGPAGKPTAEQRDQAKAERQAARQWAREPGNAGSRAERAAVLAGAGAGALAGAVRHPIDRAKSFAERARNRVAREHSEVDASSGRHAQSPQTAAGRLLRGVRVQGRIVRKGAMRAGKTAVSGAGKAAVAVGRHPVKTAKYAAMGLGVIGLMAAPPVAAGVGAAYASKKIYDVGRPRAWKARSASRLERYREAQREAAPPEGTPTPNRPTPPSDQSPPRTDDDIDSYDDAGG